MTRGSADCKGGIAREVRGALGLRPISGISMLNLF